MVDDPSLEEVGNKILAASKLGAEMVVFSGGEPTIRKDFPAIAKIMKSMGLPFGIVSNARMLFYEDYFNDLAGSGLRYVLISLHGPNAEIHNSLTGSDSFDQTVTGLKRCVQAGISTTVNYVLTKGNLNCLNEMVDMVSSLPGVVLKLSFAETKGAAREGFGEIVPDISIAARKVMEAVEYSTSISDGRKIVLCDGFTPCLIDGFEKLNDDLFTHGFEWMSEVFEDGFYPVDHGARSRPEVCEECGKRAECPGVYSGYLELKGAGEFRPL